MNVLGTKTVAAGKGKIEAFLKDIEPFFHKRPVIYVDVGAHRGDIFRELELSELNVNRACLLEPNPNSFEFLQQNVASLGAETRANCYNMALSDRPGRLRLQDADSMSKVVADEAQPEGILSEQLLEVEAQTLDALAQSFPVRHISILKIDVEGHEAEVLRGAEALLVAQEIDVIYIEAGMNPDGEQQTYYRVIEDILLGHGYRLFQIYEQMHEWIEDSPFLRRVNMAFMSRTFAERHPFRLTRDLQALRRKLGAAEEDLKSHKTLVGQLRERTKDLDAECQTLRAERERAGAELSEGLSRRKALQSDLDARHAELARLVQTMEDERTQHAEECQALEDRLHDMECQVAKLTAEPPQPPAADRVDPDELKKLRAAGAELARLETDQARLKADLAELRRYGATVEAAHLAMLGSTSWRITEPIRRIARGLRGKSAPKRFRPRLTKDPDEADR